MPISTLYIKRNDLQPYYYARVADSTGTAIDLSGATVRFTMKDVDSGVLKISPTTTGVTVTVAASGLVQYQWAAGNTGSIGIYAIEFEITPALGGKFTVPARGPALVVIVPDEDNV